MKKALISGITGQDGSYLADLLIEKNYQVWGIVRRSSSFNRARIEHLYLNKKNPKFKMVYGDLGDSSSLSSIISEINPDEIYNLGAQSHVGLSFEIPEYTADITGTGCIRIMESISKLCPNARYYQASSSELFGKIQTQVQTEETPFYPRSPYACAKAYSFYITRNYREAYNLFASNGILFNHESPRRVENFVTRKITLSIARILNKQQKYLILGNLNAKRDWGYAPDYVYGMWKILQHDSPSDFVLATGETHSVREFVEKAFAYVGINIVWDGIGEMEKGINKKTGDILIKVSKDYFRPSEVDILLGDSRKARKELNWVSKTSFDELIQIMVNADLKYVENYQIRYRL